MPTSGATRILLVDDDSFYRVVLGDALKQAGYEISTASDGMAALDQIRQKKPDVVILDMLLPKIEGERVLRFLREDERYGNLPVILLSGIPEASLPASTVQSAHCVVTKSEMNETFQKILQALSRYSKQDPSLTTPANVPFPIQTQNPQILVQDLFSKTRFLEMILHQIRDGVLVTDDEKRLVVANPCAEALLRVPERELIGKFLWQIFPEITERLPGLQGSLECERHGKTLHMQCSPLVDGQSPKGLLLVISDHTEVRHLDNERREFRDKLEFEVKQRTVDLERTNRLKSEFLANMSHELRSPLNDVLGFTQLLLARTYGELNHRQDEAISLMTESAHGLLNLINSILDLSKLESDESDVNLENFDASDLVEEMLKSCSHLVRGRPVKIRKNLGSNLPQIFTDRGKMKQVLMNVMHNAIKFTKRGSIKVSVQHLAAQKAIEFSIEDTGIGIDKKDQEIIFDAFRQVDGSSTREYQGTGLGLAIVKRILDLLHGQISLTSAAGVGSTFRIVLPLQY